MVKTYNNTVDKKLMLDIFRIGSMSGVETEMIKFIEDFLEENNISFTTDPNGNIYNISNKNRPLLSAHTDTVQDTTDFMLAKMAKIQGDIVRSYGVLGGDDKAGIYIILHILKQIPDINFVFFVEEEIGGNNGSAYWSNIHGDEVKKNIPWSMVIDRRGATDILCNKHFGGYGTKEFEEVLLLCGHEFGFKAATGSISDADRLKEFTSSCNISAGYYNPHSKNEYVYIPDVENIINFVFSCIENIKKKYEPEENMYSGYGNYLGNYDYSDIDFDDDFFGIGYDGSFGDGTSKYYVDTLKDFYTMKELDDILIEIIEIQEKEGRFKN